jgi:hypothetical protein
MASFTDSIPQFNPYVQQLPVEAMVQVGMQKQKQYDEGIQKIQTNIDNIAGLEVTRDVEKAYLQSKLNQLGNDLSLVAAGDFSNFQLVNSVNGMTNQIVRDPNIQNFVSSSAKRKKEYAFMEEARKKGELNASNEYVFKVKDSDWVNSTELDKPYSASYTPYKDIGKKAMEAIKALHPKLQQIDIPNVVRPDGSIDMSKIADVMKRKKIEGITEDQIKQAIYATFDEGDYNQLKIDSQYRFRGLDSEALTLRAEETYKSNRNNAIETLQYLDIQKNITTDPNKLDTINSQIEQYKRLLGADGKEGDLDKQFYENVQEARSNPDLVKYNIYKDQFVKQYANAFTWKSETEEIMKSPVRDQLNWVEEMKFKQQQENRQRYEFAENKKLKEQELILKAQENALKKLELFGDPTINDWTDLGSETDSENRAKELYASNASSVKSDIDSDMSALGKKYSTAEINVMLKDWQNAQGVPSKATKVPADAKDLIQNIAKNNNYLKSLKTYEEKIRKQSEKEAGVSDIIENALKGKTNLTFTSEGKRRTLTAREIVEVKLAEVLLDVETPGAPTKKFSFIDAGKLNENQLAYAKAVYGRSNIAYRKNGKLVPSKERGFTVDTDTRYKIGDLVKPHMQAAGAIKNVYSKADAIYERKLGEVANQFVPQIKAVAKSKGVIPPVVVSRIEALIRAAESKGLAADDVYDPAVITSFLSDENIKDTEVFVHREGQKYEVQVTNRKSPGVIQRLKVSPNEIANKLGPEYINNKAVEASRLTLGRGNTNLTGNPEDAQFQKQFGNFPKIQKFQVTADLVQDLSNSDLFTYSINIKKKDGRYAQFSLSGSDKSRKVGYDQGRANLDNLTDAVLLQKIKEEYPDYDFSKLDY